MSGPHDPPRLLDDDGTPAALREMLRGAQAQRPSSAQAAQMLARLRALDAVPPSDVAPRPVDAPARSTAAQRRAWPTWAVGGAALLSVVLLLLWFARRPPTVAPPRDTPPARPAATSPVSASPVSASPVSTAAPPDAPTRATASSAPAATSVAAQAAPDPSATPTGVLEPAGAHPRLPERAARTLGPGAHAAAPSACDTADEMARIRTAQRALGGGDFRLALATTERDAAACPDGEFAQERERLAIEALVRLDRIGQAQERWRRFQARYPASVYRRRLEVILRGDGGS